MNHAADPTITHIRTHRILRAGVCPVLEWTVSYPCLCTTDGETCAGSPEAVRFNKAYQTIAEHLMVWIQGPLLESVMAEFEAAGSGAAYRFDRRLAVCDMTAARSFDGGSEGGGYLMVTRTLHLSSRRGELEERKLIARDQWRWPELTLCPVETHGKLHFCHKFLRK